MRPGMQEILSPPDPVSRLAQSALLPDAAAGRLPGFIIGHVHTSP